MKVQCRTCDGIYAPTLADGTQYFHVCPPLRRLRVRNLDGTFATVAPEDVGLRKIVGERFVDRPNRRDENVRRDPVTGASVIVAEGAGTAPVDDNLIP